MHPSPGGRAQSPAARLATSAETCERGEAVDTYAQAIVQCRRSLATDSCPKSMSPSLRRMVLEAAGSSEHPVQREATWLVPQADTFIVHQLAALESQALRSSPWSGQCDNLGAGEVTVLDLEDTEGAMRLPPFVGG